MFKRNCVVCLWYDACNRLLKSSVSANLIPNNLLRDKCSTHNIKLVGCFSFGPEHIQSPDIWSPSIGPQEQTVPAHLVPETIGPPGQLVPKHLVPMDKWSPGQLVPLDKWSPNIWSPWTNGPPKNWSPWTIGPQNLLVVFKSSLKHFF